MAEDSKEAGSWWKTLPGILTGIGSTLAAAAALVAALSQAGLVGSKKPPEVTVTATASVSPSVVATTSAAPRSEAAELSTGEPALPTAPTGAGRSLFAQLAQANIHNSVGDVQMKAWLADPDGGYRRLALACLALLGGKALAGQGADLDVVSYVYVKAIGVAGDDLPANHQIRLPLLRTALLKAYANKNGTEARSLDDVVR